MRTPVAVVAVTILIGCQRSDSGSGDATARPPIRTAESAFADLERSAADSEQALAALNQANWLIRDFPEAAEARRAEAMLPELERAVQRAEERRRQAEAEAEERRRREAAEAERRRLANKWTYTTSDDAMTSRVSRFARIESENTVDFDFPYSGPQRATLTLRQHASFGKGILFSIERGQLLCRGVTRCSLRVRFDDHQPQSWSASPPADHSSTVLFLDSYDRFVEQLRNAGIVRVQAEVYEEGAPIFEFHVGGFDYERYRRGS